MEQQIKEKQNKIYWLALASLFFGAISLIWGIFSPIAIILGAISLKKIKKWGLEHYRELAILGIILGVIGAGLWIWRSYSVFRTFYKSGSEEIEITKEDIKRRLLYTDIDCNVGIALENGVYESFDYPCGEKTIEKVLFQIYDGKIAIGDLNGDNRDDVAVVIAKDYGGDRQVIYELSVSINKTVIGAEKKMLVPKARKLLEGEPDIEDIEIENGTVLLSLIRCCPEEKENIRYMFTEGSQFLQEIEDKTTGWKIYKNETYGFEVKYPSFLESGELGCRISEIEDTIFIGPISLIFFDIQGLTLNEWINREIAKAEEETKKIQERFRQAGYENWQEFGSKLLSREEIFIGGEKAVKLSYQFVGAGFDLPVTISIKKGDRIYDFRTNDANLVQEECAAKFGKKPSETMELILSTFKFLD